MILGCERFAKKNFVSIRHHRAAIRRESDNSPIERRQVRHLGAMKTVRLFCFRMRIVLVSPVMKMRMGFLQVLKTGFQTPYSTQVKCQKKKT